MHILISEKSVLKQMRAIDFMGMKDSTINCEQSDCKTEGRAAVTCQASDKNGVHSVIDFERCMCVCMYVCHKISSYMGPL